jgi:hypothetical protein
VCFFELLFWTALHLNYIIINCIKQSYHREISDAISVNEFCHYHNDKVDAVCQSTEGSPELVFSIIPPGCSLFERFAASSPEVVTALIRWLPDKQSFCDVLPVPVWKQVTAEIAPFLASFYNRSMSTGVFPDQYKTAYITPIIKKPGLVITDARSYQPTSNLSVASKLLDRLVTRQVINHLQSNNLLPNQHIDQTFRPRPQPCRCCPTFYRPSIKEMSQF